MNELLAVERKDFRRSALTKLRQEGQIPGTVYGVNQENLAVYVDSKDFFKVMKEVGRNGVFSLDINGKKIHAILSEYQAEPIKREVIHVDFLAVDLNKEITATVPVVPVGEAQGVKDGGVLTQSIHELEVTSIPTNMPSKIEVDVTDLVVGETITVQEIMDRTNLKINDDGEQIVFSILPPKQEEEISTGEEQEPGIPENVEGRETDPTQ